MLKGIFFSCFLGLSALLSWPALGSQEAKLPLRRLVLEAYDAAHLQSIQVEIETMASQRCAGCSEIRSMTMKAGNQEIPIPPRAFNDLVGSFYAAEWRIYPIERGTSYDTLSFILFGVLRPDPDTFYEVEIYFLYDLQKATLHARHIKRKVSNQKWTWDKVMLHF